MSFPRRARVLKQGHRSADRSASDPSYSQRYGRPLVMCGRPVTMYEKETSGDEAQVPGSPTGGRSGSHAALNHSPEKEEVFPLAILRAPTRAPRRCQ